MKKIVLMAVVLVGTCAFAVYMKKKLEKKQSVALAAYSFILLMTVITGRRLLRKVVKIYLM